MAGHGWCYVLFLIVFSYIDLIIDSSHTFEQLKTTSSGHVLRPLISSLSDKCHRPTIVAALLYVMPSICLIGIVVLIYSCRVLKWHYGALDPDERGLNETRGYACEVVAWRFLAHLSESELIDYLLYELPSNTAKPNHKRHDPLHRVHFDHDGGDDSEDDRPAESDGLLPDQEGIGYDRSSHRIQDPLHMPSGLNGDVVNKPEEDPTSPFIGLNALEIAAVADAKGFLSQRVVQKIVNSIWCGDIVFWDSLNVRTKKKAQRYNKRYIIMASSILQQV